MDSNTTSVATLSPTVQSISSAAVQHHENYTTSDNFLESEFIYAVMFFIFVVLFLLRMWADSRNRALANIVALFAHESSSTLVSNNTKMKNLTIN